MIAWLQNNGRVDRTPVESKAMSIRCKGFGVRLRERSMISCISCDGAYIVLKGKKNLELFISKWPIRKFPCVLNHPSKTFENWEKSTNVSLMRG